MYVLFLAINPKKRVTLKILPNVNYTLIQIWQNFKRLITFNLITEVKLLKIFIFWKLLPNKTLSS